jgi:hypothetical protein
MPKTEIDYSNTIIYKITCKDPNVTDIYVGYTTNFIQRKHTHKQSCTNIKSTNYKCKLYEVIRNNGGWNNWQMEIINIFNCADHYEARQKEQIYFIELQATLNSIEPMPKQKHKKAAVNPAEKNGIKMELIYPQKSLAVFYCESCDYNTSNKKDYSKHCLTSKHKTGKNGMNLELQKSSNYVCDCGKHYMSQSGLWKHEKKCQYEKPIVNDTKDKDSIINLLLTQNKDLMDLLKNGIINNTNNNNNITNINKTTNNDNKTFNLNIFLNETCKDAMNIDEFVSSIKVNLEELENTGRQGYIEGISNIILKRLNNLEQDFRPIHCSDAKREVFYIKDNNEWQKENENKPILKRAIKVIANENIKQIQHWRNKHPDCTKSDSKKNNLYLKIVSNSMNGSTEEESLKNIDKIISNIAKEVIINKSAVL